MPRTAHPLHDDLVSAGYYPQLVENVLDLALAGESVTNHLVHVATTFDSEVRRHLTAMAITPTRLVVAHVDDAVDAEGVPGALATTDSVALGEIRSVSMTYGVGDPANNSVPTDVTMAINWGVTNRLDLEPVICPDPECTADHGLTGRSISEDMVVRISATADGESKVNQALEFARILTERTSGRR